jgi:anti-sigma regulatory factor (Ser/Thr protein kinase)
MDRLQRSITMAEGFEVLSDLRASVAHLEPPMPEDLRDPAALVLTELVTNSLRHAVAEDEPVEVTVARLAEHRVRIEVRDPGPCFDPGTYTPPLAPAEGGVGLYLVGSIAERWGVEREDDGWCLVWAEVALPA